MEVEGEDFTLDHGDVVIAAITSCTNTSNPSVMLGAGLLAKKAVEAGLESKPWVKTSLAPGSKVVTEYLDRAGLTEYLEKLGFDLVGYGCTTCIGNSGPLPEHISKAIKDNDLAVASVLSGNRNFEGRIHPEVKMNYLASPPLCVAYALAGSMKVDLVNDDLGRRRHVEGPLAVAAGDRGGHRAGRDHRHVPQELRRDLRGRRELEGARHPRGRPLRVGRRVHLREARAVLRRHAGRSAGGVPADHGRAHPRGAGRQRDHRPHLAGRLDQEGLARGQVPDRATASSRRTSTPTARAAATTR